MSTEENNQVILDQSKVSLDDDDTLIVIIVSPTGELKYSRCTDGAPRAQVVGALEITKTIALTPYIDSALAEMDGDDGDEEGEEEEEA